MENNSQSVFLQGEASPAPLPCSSWVAQRAKNNSEQLVKVSCERGGMFSSLLTSCEHI